MRTLGLLLTALLYLVLVGCASVDPEWHNKEVDRVASSVEPTTERLSNFSKFELLPIRIAQGITDKPEKGAYARTIETRLKNGLGGLINLWNDAGDEEGRSLTIEPELTSLRVVSDTSRYWIGSWGGASSAIVKLHILDADTGENIGTPEISRSYNPVSEPWDSDITDESLPEFVAEIVRRYLEINY